MNKKNITGLIVLMGISILGIIVVQLVWMNNAIRVKNELFNRGVNEALTNTVNKLEDILKGYNVGADDYITKPFDTEVLLCKIQAIIKRQTLQPIRDEVIFTIGTYVFDSKLRFITREGIKQKLSPKEADLLKLLCQNKNELLPRETALRKIWGEDGYFTARSMDVFITKLRKFLANDSNIEIKNIYGSGFLLEVKETV